MSGTKSTVETDSEVKTLADGGTEITDPKTEIIEGDGVITEKVEISTTVIEPPPEISEVVEIDNAPPVLASPEIVIETPKEIEPWQALQTQLTALQQTQAATLTALEMLAQQMKDQQTRQQSPAVNVDAQAMPNLPPEVPEVLEVPKTPEEEKPKGEKKPKPEPEKPRRRWL